MKLIQHLIACSAMALTASTALAQFTPTAPVKMWSVFPTGSGPDVVARLVADKLQGRWGQSVIVEAKPGGAGAVAINAMKNAPPTGHDLVVVDVGNMSINPLIFKKLSYDPAKDLVPVAVLYKAAFFVVVGMDSPNKSLKDFMAAASKKDAPLRYGSNAVGGPIHLGSARLETALGAEMLHVPYKETSQLYAAVSTGEVDWAYGSIATAGALIRGNKLRVLAVSDAKRSPAMPDVPTLAESGGPKDLDALTWVALMAPRGTPASVIAEINKGVNDALSQPDVKEKMANFGFTISTGSPQQVSDLMSVDLARYAEVLKKVKVSVD
ncbi:tripartite tricarboxylate transporter substrate binding protein [Limnohabitans sp. JirII-31]|uniref:Bug family tripartite tricarboxylate transporter substrate binding protein n=1 Tax=Limnohabitans sp. JirII-31 TaxID=1977908 RepID=UPI001E31D966|nr:tripartite tricarboxylate transporter substrate binding protein [Limnohabitans sp. JirII-31]